MNRRRFLSYASAGAALLLTRRITFASADTDRRFVFLLQRGAADGLHIIPPFADRDYERLRGSLAVDPATLFKLDGNFGLHSAMTETAKMYRAGEALFVHAVASPYRDRSHFDGQNVVETGGSRPYQVKDGWLNRLASLLPKGNGLPIAFAPAMPMALRGSAPVNSFAPAALAPPNAELLLRVAMLYQDDPLLHPLWSAATDLRGMADHASAKQDPTSAGKLAASFLARPDGPRIAMIESTGWDTHNQQTPRLQRLLTGLDAELAALRTGMGEAWAKTTVLIATEFGRTAAVNGTGGTDHGTATAAMLIGGAVKGGRVIADWPGLSQGALFERRDLKPTMNLDSLITGGVSETFGIDPLLIARHLFPGIAAAKPVSGLIS